MTEVLPRNKNSYGVLRLGWCGALLAEDVECDLKAGHLDAGQPHKAHSPYGTGQFIVFDDDGTVLDKSPGL